MVNFDQEYDVYVTSEVGDFSVGGVSFWVDNWIRYVVPHLRVKPVLIVEVESSPGWIKYAKSVVSITDRPGTEHKYEWKYPGLQLENYFSLPFAGMGFDHTIDLSKIFHFNYRGFVQGNFNEQFILLENNDFINELNNFINIMRNIPNRDGWICGLGHGINKNTPEKNIHIFVENIRKNFS